MRRTFEGLSAKEVLALAVAVERANAERFRTYASVFRGYNDEVSNRFEELAGEEESHERLLLERFEESFGGELPRIEETDVAGVIEAVELDEAEHLIFDSLAERRVYELALRAEIGAREFYHRAAATTEDPNLASLYRELWEMEQSHQSWLEARLAGESGGGEEGDA